MYTFEQKVQEKVAVNAKNEANGWNEDAFIGNKFELEEVKRNIKDSDQDDMAAAFLNPITFKNIKANATGSALASELKFKFEVKFPSK